MSNELQPTFRGLNRPQNAIMIVPVNEYDRLQRTAAKATRRRAALKQHMKAYMVLKAENLGLRQRLHESHEREVASAIREALR